MKYNIFLVGPSASGKTFLGKYIERKRKISFIDCDIFHNKKNINKMKKGIPLNNSDRNNWIKKIKKNLLKKQKVNLIIAFSGLKKQHRNIIKSKNKLNFFFFLKTSKKILKKRLLKRKNHFFKYNKKMLDEQIQSFYKSRDLKTLDSTKSSFSNLKRIFKLIKIQ